MENRKLWLFDKLQVILLDRITFIKFVVKFCSSSHTIVSMLHAMNSCAVQAQQNLRV